MRVGKAVGSGGYLPTYLPFDIQLEKYKTKNNVNKTSIKQYIIKINQRLDKRPKYI